jgi:hypothetical protein
MVAMRPEQYEPVKQSPIEELFTKELQRGAGARYCPRARRVYTSKSRCEVMPFQFPCHGSALVEIGSQGRRTRWGHRILIALNGHISSRVSGSMMIRCLHSGNETNRNILLDHQSCYTAVRHITYVQPQQQLHLSCTLRITAHQDDI